MKKSRSLGTSSSLFNKRKLSNLNKNKISELIMDEYNFINKSKK